jgi:hypothetical protein
LQGTTLFGLLNQLHPGRYQTGQLRTLHRQIAAWRAQYGPGGEVIFPQIHEPGEAAQSDFTYMNSLGVTLGGVPFPHLVFHLVLVYSNVEAIQICFSESYESLVEGIETCLWRVGGIPRQHRTDHLGATLHPLTAPERGQAKERYRRLMAHYALEPTTNNLGNRSNSCVAIITTAAAMADGATLISRTRNALQLLERGFVRVLQIGPSCAGGRSYVHAHHIAALIYQLGRAVWHWVINRKDHRMTKQRAHPTIMLGNWIESCFRHFNGTEADGLGALSTSARRAWRPSTNSIRPGAKLRAAGSR